MIENKKYKIVSIHEIHEDNYKNGEGDYIQTFTLESEVKDISWQSAVNKHFANYNYGTFALNTCELDGGNLLTSFTVNADNVEADAFDLAQWRKGKITLFSDSVQVSIYEIKPVNLLTLTQPC